MPKRGHSSVSVETQADGRVMISGGRLAPGLVWMPTPAILSDVDGHGQFVELHTTDCGLSALCGASLRCNKFLDNIKLARDKACDDAINARIATLFGVDSSNAFPPKLRTLRTIVLVEHAASLPTVVMIKLDRPATEIAVPFEGDKRKRVAVRCDGCVLTYIVEGLGWETCTNNRLKKPRSPNKLHSEHPEVRMNHKRGCAYINYRDADGKMRYHSASVTDAHGEQGEVFIDVARKLHEFFLENNCDDNAEAAAEDTEEDGIHEALE